MKNLLLILAMVSVICMASPQGVPTQTTFTCGLTQLQMLAQNNNRGYLIFQNQGSDTSGHCHFKAGAAIISPDGLWVDHAQNYETVEAFTKQPWYCQCDSAAQRIEILYTNY